MRALTVLRNRALKFILTLIAGIFLASCASQQANIPGTDINEKVFELSPVQLDVPTLSFEALEKKIGALNKYIGSYPPRFANENERELVYKNWLSLVSEAEAYNKVNSNNEKSLYLLSELYRQGHNMDVSGSAEKALSNLDSCLLANEYSIPCNFSASYFYLSVGAAYLDKAEKSLSVLKNHYNPKLNHEVEAGYVFLYLYRQNVPMAKKQIDLFIKSFPDSSRVAAFTNIKKNLGDTIEWKQH